MAADMKQSKKQPEKQLVELVEDLIRDFKIEPTVTIKGSTGGPLNESNPSSKGQEPEIPTSNSDAVSKPDHSDDVHQSIGITVKTHTDGPKAANEASEAVVSVDLLDTHKLLVVPPDLEQQPDERSLIIVSAYMSNTMRRIGSSILIPRDIFELFITFYHDPGIHFVLHRDREYIFSDLIPLRQSPLTFNGKR